MCVQVQLSEYTMTSVTEGIEALATTRVSIRPVGGHADQGFVMHAQVPTIPLSEELVLPAVCRWHVPITALSEKLDLLAFYRGQEPQGTRF